MKKNLNPKGSSFRPDPTKSYIAFNKPYAVLSQFSQPEGSTKSTLANFTFPKDVYPVGRLDYDSEGLLLLTDDPRLNQLILSPNRGHERTYFVQVENIPATESINSLSEGVMVEGRMTAKATARVLLSEPNIANRVVPIRARKNIPTSWLSLTLTEGRNRQVRKMTAAVGHPTLRLYRISIGRLSLFDLKLLPGQWKKLTTAEIDLLFK